MFSPAPVWAAVLVVAALLLTGCSSGDGAAQGAGGSPSPGSSSSTSGEPSAPAEAAVPQNEQCYPLTAAEVAKPSNESEPVDCAEPHTAQTFLVATFPAKLKNAGYDDPRLGATVYENCNPAFIKFLGGGESMSMRSLLSWGWFRPSQQDWDAGARWFRCDLLGAPSGDSTLTALPTQAKGMLSARPPEDWMLCAKGDDVGSAPRVPCAQPHDWRAVTTIVLGEKRDPYPGDHVVEVRSRQFCSDSVGAWLNYPVTNYDYGATAFHEGEWKAGNRRSICWARTSR